MTESVDLRLKYKQSEGDILVKGVLASVNEALLEIIETAQGTRLFNRGFGSRLNRLLFEPMNSLTASLILITIEQALDREEPRAELDVSRSEIIPDYDNNLYELKLVYIISGKEEVGEFNSFLSTEIR